MNLRLSFYASPTNLQWIFNSAPNSALQILWPSFFSICLSDYHSVKLTILVSSLTRTIFGLSKIIAINIFIVWDLTKSSAAPFYLYAGWVYAQGFEVSWLSQVGQKRKRPLRTPKKSPNDNIWKVLWLKIVFVLDGIDGERWKQLGWRKLQEPTWSVQNIDRVSLNI